MLKTTILLKRNDSQNIFYLNNIYRHLSIFHAILYKNISRPKFFRRKFFHVAGLPDSGTWRATRRGINCTRDQVLEHPEERPCAIHGPAVRATRRSIGDGLLDSIPEPGRAAQAIRGDQGRGGRCRQLSL